MITIKEKNENLDEIILEDITPETTETVVIPAIVEEYTFGSMKGDLEAVEAEIISVTDFYIEKHNQLHAEEGERLGKLTARKAELENKISEVDNLLSQ